MVKVEKVDAQDTAELLCKALNQRLGLENSRRRRQGSLDTFES